MTMTITADSPDYNVIRDQVDALFSAILELQDGGASDSDARISEIRVTHHEGVVHVDTVFE